MFVWPRLSDQTGKRMQGLMQHWRTVSALLKSFSALLQDCTALIHGLFNIGQFACMKHMGMACSSARIVDLERFKIVSCFFFFLLFSGSPQCGDYHAPGSNFPALPGEDARLCQAELVREPSSFGCVVEDLERGVHENNTRAIKASLFNLVS